MLDAYECASVAWEAGIAPARTCKQRYKKAANDA